MRKNRKEVLPGLDTVLAKMMAPKPGDRYQTPGEVARALEPYTRDGKHVQIAAAPIVDRLPALKS